MPSNNRLSCIILHHRLSYIIQHVIIRNYGNRLEASAPGMTILADRRIHIYLYSHAEMPTSIAVLHFTSLSGYNNTIYYIFILII